MRGLVPLSEGVSSLACGCLVSGGPFPGRFVHRSSRSYYLFLALVGVVAPLLAEREIYLWWWPR